jgi:hypothetical protein
MSSLAPLAFRGRNPDVLTCIANLSNDEVFTPPELAQQMLDMVATAWAESHGGASIWADPTVRFLDPFTKSGVFLREITARLVTGLAPAMPDLQERVNHILTKQVFGIAVTELTALLARRTLYCSKWANGPHSIATAFANPRGNIWFERTEHSWSGERCSFCGASKSVLDRGDALESHAYAFLHTNDIQARIAELFGENMQFDVIIGNPPYQLDDGGQGASAVPIYNKFVEQAKVLQPRFLTMIIPSRWFAGGKGLDEFRDSMLRDRRISVLNDFLVTSDVFPGVELRGGVCYFLWDKSHEGDCRVITNIASRSPSAATRPLLESGATVFLRFNEAVSIVKKVVAFETKTASLAPLSGKSGFARLVSSRKPFGFDTTVKGSRAMMPNDLVLFQNGGSSFISRQRVHTGNDLIDTWKVFISMAYGAGSDPVPSRVLGKGFVGEPGTVCTETYLCIGPFASKLESENVVRYLSTKFARFLVLMNKPSQHATKKVYSFLPTQDWSIRITDADLYLKYGLTDDEIAHIESIIRPMDAADE